VGDEDARAARIERHLRGFDMAMVETAYRYAELHAAGEDRNWGYALYQAAKLRLAVANGVERRPKRAASAHMLEGPLAAVEEAARADDVSAFDAAFVQLTDLQRLPPGRARRLHPRRPPARPDLRAGEGAHERVHGVRRPARAGHQERAPSSRHDRRPARRADDPSATRRLQRSREHLSSRRVELVVASPTVRTRQTAEAIANAAGVAAIETAALSSLRKVMTSGPSMQGATTSESESLEDGVARALAAVEALARPGGAIVLVTHGDIAAGLIGQALGTPVERRVAEHDPPEGSVAELSVDAGVWRVVRPARAPAR
jgi:broad specificity phosphatase PhoE